MGGGPSNVTQTSKTDLPSWAVPFAQGLLSTMGGVIAPGTSLAQGGVNLAPYNPAMNPQVAGFTPYQQGGLQALGTGAGAQAQLGGATAGQLASTLGGQYPISTPDVAAQLANTMGGQFSPMTPETASFISNNLAGNFIGANPYLQSMADAASRGTVENFQKAIAPSIMAGAIGAGMGGSSAERDAMGNAQFNLGQQLADIQTNLYGTAYSQDRAQQMQAANLAQQAYEQQRGQQLQAANLGQQAYEQQRAQQLQAAGLLPTAQAGLTAPGQTLLQAGTFQQGQQQNILDAQRQAAMQQAQWPFTQLGALGSALAQAIGGTGTYTGTGPNPYASKL